MTLLIQDFLQEHSLEDVNTTYHIDIKRHQDYLNLVLFKYNQLESNLADPLVRQCRGLILDESNNWKVISYPYDKFFNYGEPTAATIDWDTARVFEKVDGSLAVLYWYDGKWNVQTSGTPDASGQVDDWSFTFKELFWKTWNELGYKLPENTDLCYMFELMTPYNRVIVPHKSSRIVFHGARYIHEEWEYEEFDYYWQVCECEYTGWELIKSFPLQNWEQILEAAKHLDPMVQEGYVVCDAQFNRVKLKTPQYVALAHIRDSKLGPRRFLNIIRNNESDEFLTYFPEFKDEYYKIKIKFESLITQLETTYNLVKHIAVQKDFALAIQNVPFKAALFSLRSGKIKSIREYFIECNIKHLETYFEHV